MAQRVVAGEERDLSPKEAARVLGVSARTVLRACGAGLLGYRVTSAEHSHWRISRVELLRYRRIVRG